MRVCLICEGCYPYIPGGVSSWIQMICTQFSDIEFIIWSIATNREEMSKVVYTLPENIVDVHTLYLGEKQFGEKYRKVVLSDNEKEILKGLVLGGVREINWRGILDLIKKYRKRMEDILMSEAFYDICLEEYKKQESKKGFHHFLWNFRGLYLPLMSILSDEIPKADIYHSVSTGYAGIMASCASFIEKKPFILTEHGIYTREREEDIIRSRWVAGEFKQLWIDSFKKLSLIAYYQADVVTSLFEVNKTLQVELGCPEEKIIIIPNGVAAEEFEDLPSKGKLDDTLFQIGTVLRVVPIKDVKSMLLAFDIVNERMPDTKLNIMGNYTENPDYFEECKELAAGLELKNVEFLGQVDIKDYFPEIDLLLLSSISEGQPLAILEGMAAGIPFAATNVGDCRALLEGQGEDDFGSAGIIVPVMNSEAMAEAILYCIRNSKERARMGIAGKNRVQTYYQKSSFLNKYRELYSKVVDEKHRK